MVQSLTPVERRVLGVLIEKALAQPQYYPMTLNAVTVACNQKNNRDPEMSLDEDTVYDTLEKLRTRGMAVRASTAGGRTDRFRHLANEAYGWDGRQRAIMAELLLRGPQTVGELRTRASRMTPFDSVEAVQAVLDALRTHEPPFVAEMPRQPGQSATRWTHLLYPDGEQPPLRREVDAAPAAGQAAAPPAVDRSVAAAVGSTALLAALREELDSAQSEIAELQEAVGQLRRRVETLEQRG